MPQFKPGESKTAKVSMRNPAGKAFEYTGYIYLGTDLAVVSEKAFSLVAGEEKQISFPVVIPGQVGTYPVHIGVFSGEKNIGLYRAIEDVIITLPPVGNFVYSDESFERRPFSELDPDASPTNYYVTFRCTITNQALEKGTRTIGFYRRGYSNYYGKWFPPILHKSIELSLESGNDYQFVFDPRLDAADLLLVSPGSTSYFVYLLDSAGGESLHLQVI